MVSNSRHTVLNLLVGIFIGFVLSFAIFPNLGNFPGVQLPGYQRPIVIVQVSLEFWKIEHSRLSPKEG